MLKLVLTKSENISLQFPQMRMSGLPERKKTVPVKGQRAICMRHDTQPNDTDHSDIEHNDIMNNNNLTL